MTAPLLTVEGVSKRFGAIQALEEVTFGVNENSTFALLGPNGSGKTTLIRILNGLIPPSAGGAHLDDLDIMRHPGKVRQLVGMVPQALTSDLDLTAYENMDIYGALYRLKRRDRRERIESLLKVVQLWERRNKLVATFSGGMRRRLEIARCLLHYPRLLFLDEPTIGLDPQSRLAIWDVIEKLQEEYGFTIFLTTHYMEEADQHADRVAIIDHGKILRLDTPAVLKASLPEETSISLSVNPEEAEKCLSFLQAEEGVHEATRDPSGTITFYYESPERILPVLLGRFTVTNLQIHRVTLEDVFIHLTGRAIRDEEQSVNLFIGAGVPRKL